MWFHWTSRVCVTKGFYSVHSLLCQTSSPKSHAVYWRVTKCKSNIIVPHWLLSFCTHKVYKEMETFRSNSSSVDVYFQLMFTIHYFVNSQRTQLVSGSRWLEPRQHGGIVSSATPAVNVGVWQCLVMVWLNNDDYEWNNILTSNWPSMITH